MTNLIDKNANASLCGMVTTVCAAKVESLVEEQDGSVTIAGGTQGTNDNTFPVVIRAKESAADQLRACQKAAVDKGLPQFRFQASGPVEVELGTNKLGAEDKPLVLNIAAITARAVHPNKRVDPLQNSAVLTGRLVQKVFNNGGSSLTLEFGHLLSAVDSKSSPAAVKLTNTSAKELANYADQDVMVAGTFSRQTSMEGSGDIKPHDHISFSVDSAQVIQIAAGKTRYKTAPKPNVNSVIVADYESGYETDGNSSLNKDDLDSLDF